MEFDAINKKYWSTVEPKKILAGLCFPGDELTKLLEPKSKVLDVGCGSGKVSEYLDQKNYVVTGIDINTKALEENKKRNQNIEYKEVDISETLPFNDAYFDAIVVPYVFVSIIDGKRERAVATELIRVLKNGGIIWICEATHSADYLERYRIGKEATGLDNVALSFSKNPQQSTEVERIIRHYSEKEIDALFEPLQKLSTKQTAVVSPSSGMTVQTVVSVYKKK